MERAKKQSAFISGVRDGIPICLGYLSVGFAFGIFAVNNGLSILEAVYISMFNVTSAGQLAAVPIITAGGSLIELACSQLVINLRYALMSISLSQKLDGSMTRAHRAAIAFVNTDETFAVASSQPGAIGKAYLYGLILLPWLGWSGGTLAGAVAGDILPAMITASLGIAIYGMFIAVVVPAAKQSRAIALCALLSVLLSCLFCFVPALSNVPSGFVIIICAVLASAVMAAAAPVPPEEGEAAHD